MTRYHHGSSALTVLVLLTLESLPHLSTPNLLTTPREVNTSQRDTLLWLTASSTNGKKNEETPLIHKDEAEELFKDVDPKTLATVLLEALNNSKVGRKGKKEYNGLIEERKVEGNEKLHKEVKTTKEGRDRDGRQELELLMTAQGKDQQRQEEEERKKAQEEEENMIEKVISHTKSQTIQNQTEQEHDGQQGSTSLSPDEEEEEQLSLEELKSLETMMKEFPRLYVATNKWEEDPEHNQRQSRGYNSYNDIITINKGTDLTMSTNKLKWQEETQKALNFPIFKGGSYINDFKDSTYDAYPAQPQLPTEQEVRHNDKPMGVEEGEEMLTSEEEEARAKMEQEEIRRQAAEAQRAKMEEEKLADIASDMLLRYMVNQNNGNKKQSSTAEDKRSDEELKVIEDDDIDPQTIDKLIEISSKLHLPADDVVDIISDVKKKKKDIPPESHWRQPTRISQITTNQNNFPVPRQPSPAVTQLKTWFQEKSKPQDVWSKSEKPLLQTWSKFRNHPSNTPDLWLKPPRTGYPYTYPSYYQSRPYLDYYQNQMYLPLFLRPRPHYYISKPALTLKNLERNSMDNMYTFPPKRHYHSWVQPQLRKPPIAFQRKPYNSHYNYPVYSGTLWPVFNPKPHSPIPVPIIHPQEKQLYYSNKGYFMGAKQTDSRNHDDLEKYIDQILAKRPQYID